MSEAIRKMTEESHAALIKALSYDKNRVIRERRIGNWIVTIEPCGYRRGCYIYNAHTLHRHYEYFEGVMTCVDDAPQDVKDFYQRAEDRTFNSVCDLASKWD